MSQVHSTAVIHPEAKLSDDIKVGPFSVIGAGVHIAAGTEIGPHVVIEGPTKIGKNCRIFPYASIGQIPQDLKFEGERTELIIGNGNVIREFVTFHRGTAGGGGKTVVGDDNFFMAYVHIAHDCQIGNSTQLANGATLAGHVAVEDNSRIGAFTGIHQFCRVGKYGFIGGYSVITKDVLPFSKTVGNRAPRCYGLNSIGLRREGFTDDKIEQIKHAFRLLLQSKLNTSQALEAIEKEIKSVEEVDYLVNFIRSSVRGVIK
jgi:UDP-N-acetylglucosamine acyltransferase